MIKIDVQIIARNGNTIIKSIPVTGETVQGTYARAEKVEDGVNINLNTDDYYTALGKPQEVTP